MRKERGHVFEVDTSGGLIIPTADFESLVLTSGNSLPPL